MVKKPTLVALSSLMALSVPTVSEKLSTSEMRKRSIKPNAVELNEDAQKDIPVTESEKSNVASDPDLITVELSQDGTSTVITNRKKINHRLRKKMILYRNQTWLEVQNLILRKWKCLVSRLMS